MDIIRKLTQGGRTVLSVIHQPSSEVFDLFDQLCLLSAGRTVYFGRARGLLGMRRLFTCVGEAVAFYACVDHIQIVPAKRHFSLPPISWNRSRETGTGMQGSPTHPPFIFSSNVMLGILIKHTYISL